MAPPPNTITLGIRISRYECTNFGGDTKHSDHSIGWLWRNESYFLSSHLLSYKSWIISPWNAVSRIKKDSSNSYTQNYQMTKQPHTWVYIQKNWKEVLKYLYRNMHSSTIHSSQKAETTQMSINRWTDEWSVAYTNNVVLFSHKKEWSANSCSKGDEPWKHAKWKKPDTKGHRVHDCIYMKYPEQVNSQTENRLVAARGWRQGEWGVTA